LSEGLKIPKSLWNRLYNYQRVGVQWMFELHQQKCGGILGRYPVPLRYRYMPAYKYRYGIGTGTCSQECNVQLVHTVKLQAFTTIQKIDLHVVNQNPFTGSIRQVKEANITNYKIYFGD
jgi:hypothetical protein